MSGANREYVDRTCLHDEVCIYREEHMRKGAERMRKGAERMRKGAERMNKSRVTEYILAYMQEKGISASEISEQTQVPEEKLHPDYKEPLLAEEFLELCVFLQLSPEAIAKTIRK